MARNNPPVSLRQSENVRILARMYLQWFHDADEARRAAGLDGMR